MTDREWSTCSDLQAMLVCLASQFRRGRTKGGRRKLRLFSCACCRQAWAFLHDDRGQEALRTTEQFADGLVGRQDLLRAERAALEAMASNTAGYPAWSAARGVREAARASATKGLTAHYWAWGALVRDEQSPGAVRQPQGRQMEQVQRDLLRDIVGNPFRPVVFHPTWRTPTVTRLAAAVYEERHLPSGLFDNARLAVLADALEDAGCDNADVLGHLRQGGEHVRGCWVVDLVLGKE